MYRATSQFSRYTLVDQEQRDIEELLKNAHLQAHIRNLQADFAEMMTALEPHQIEADEYRIRMAGLQGYVKAFQLLVRDFGDGDLV